MKQYELVTILPGETTEAKQKAFEAKLEKLVTTLEGKVEKSTSWGKKELFYPLISKSGGVKKNASGVYYFWNLSLPANQAPVLNREMEIDDEILRHLLVVEEKVAKVEAKAEEKKEEVKETKKETSTKKQTKTKKETKTN